MRLPTDLQHAKGDDTNGSTSGTNWPVTITNINALRVTATTLSAHCSVHRLPFREKQYPCLDHKKHIIYRVITDTTLRR
jgi:hypothetical protein